MGLDDKVLRVCKEAAMEHIHDVDVALDDARKRLKIPPLPDWIAALVDNALREQIHYARHLSNRRLRKANGHYGGPGKVGASSAVNAVADQIWQDSVYNHTINGWRLGNIAKQELMTMAEIERDKADGCLFNAQLCTRLSAMCAKKQGDTVEDCLSERQVESVFRDVSKLFNPESGAA